MLEETNQDWFAVKQTANFPSPSLLVFPDRIATNIQHLLQIAGSPERLWPHVKTYKMPQIVEMHLAAGIRKFKCATISEAEMLGRCGVDEVLLAYQPIGPNLRRLAQLVKYFPTVSFATVVDDPGVLQQLQVTFAEQALPLKIFLDIDSGMGRTGIVPGEAAHELYRQIHEASGLEAGGLHVYDGHFRQPDFAARKAASDAGFVAVERFQQELEAAGLRVPTVIAGGSPTFPVHALREGVSLSPGTYALWDAGYAEICPELPFLPAAVLFTRVISKPGINRLCLDLGHKSLA
jgi:D-serine deaminase-like pyridoxal phosphate-dependent protein